MVVVVECLWFSVTQVLVVVVVVVEFWWFSDTQVVVVVIVVVVVPARATWSQLRRQQRQL